jgi:hypothetical protein
MIQKIIILIAAIITLTYFGYISINKNKIKETSKKIVEQITVTTQQIKQ